jgi:multidrug efflux pump subunit AcrA (membrane-fusion protein)
MSNTDEYNDQGIIKDLEAQLETERQNVALAQEVAREQAERAQARLDEQRNHYDERLITQRDRWHAEVQAKQERIEALLETDQGKAWAEVEEMKRQVTRAEEFAERYRGRMTQAESDRDRALASVAGGEDIHPADPRVAHIWRKASRLASANQFCSEYDKIAEALGLPEIEFDYSGTVSVRVSGYVNVPVSGRATRQEIADHEIEPDISTDDILANLEHHSIDWEIDEIEVEADDDE